MRAPLFAAGDLTRSLNRVIRRLTAGRVARSEFPNAVPVATVARGGRSASIQRTAAQIAAFAEEGASCSDIARRTGLARDAVALILHLEARVRPEISTGLGTMCRADNAQWAGALGA